MVKTGIYRSAPKGSNVAGDIPGHQKAIVAVDIEWVWLHGSRSQRRRLDRALQRQRRAK